MFCPCCGAEHDLTRDGRFCSACGLSVGTTRPPATKRRVEDEPPPVRVCGKCGVPAPGEGSERCINCGSKIPREPEELL